MRGSVGYDRARKSWFYRHDLPPGPDGKRRQTTRRGFRLKRKAEEALAAALWQMGAGPPPERTTVAEWAARELHARAPGLSPVTVANYERHAVECLRRSPIGSLPVARLGEEAMARLHAWILDRYPNPETVRTHWRSIAALLRPLAVAGHLPKRALQGRLPRRQHEVPLRVWSPAETRRALAGLRGTAYETPVLVAVTTGLRRGEVLGLRWEDYDGEALLVRRSYTTAAHRPVLKTPKTRQHRRVELYPETIAALDAHRKAQQRKRWALPEWDPQGFIFPSPVKPGPWHPEHFEAGYRRALKRLDDDIPRLRFHDLRHTHASHLLAARTDAAVVAHRLGHSLQTCLRVYAHLIPGQQTIAVTRGSEYLGLQTRDNLVTIRDPDDQRVTRKPR